VELELESRKKRLLKFFGTPAGASAHYSVAQIEELLDAMERTTDGRSRTNRSLKMIRLEQLGKPTPSKVPHGKQKGQSEIGQSA
jgi:hypothetical protein